MKQLLVIPNGNQLWEWTGFVKEQQLGYEFNDFFKPAILDDDIEKKQLIEKYTGSLLPSYCTLHGAFYDVIPTSADKKIREISRLRITQSMECAHMIGVKAVVFHTNYNPFLDSREYKKVWIKENVEYWSQVLKQYPDIGIYLENMFDTSPEILNGLSEELCRFNNYGVCLDWAHAILSRVSAEIWAKELGKYVKHIHINDNDLVSDLHLAWGDGKIDRDAFYSSYHKEMSGATILIETNDLEAAKRSVQILKTDGFIK